MFKQCATLITLTLALLTAPAIAEPKSNIAEQNNPLASLDIKRLKKQAHNGNSEAQRVLGQAYLEGTDVSKDPVRAYELFVQSARQQDAQAQYLLGRSYLKGKGTDKNLISAYIWLSASSEKSSPNQADAKALLTTVATQLSDVQRQKADLLVLQLNELYLD